MKSGRGALRQAQDRLWVGERGSGLIRTRTIFYFPFSLKRDGGRGNSFIHALPIYLSLISSFLFPLSTEAQISQTIRGKVTDAANKRALIGANVVVLDTVNFRGASTDIDGNFRIDDVPIGKVSIKVSYLGYEDRFLEGVMLTPSKQLIINVELEESIRKMEEVVVTAGRDKGEAMNEMALVSARTFSVEETRRFAGSWQDPARAAAAFAGVNGGSDERNDIIIRGNSPTGVLWRLEGINIPNPNHLSFSGTTGGPVSILNNNMLADSDFFTGAFPADYGNANAGAFDIRLRKGNNEKREHYLQLGLNGLEAGIEGPFSKKHQASYLASYRYSTMAIIGAMGIDFGISAIPQYQDLTLVIDVPVNERVGRFTLWGIGGLSSIHITENPGFNSTDVEERDQKLGSDMGVAGLTHFKYLKEKSSITTTLAMSGIRQWQDNYRILPDSAATQLLEDRNRNITTSVSLHTRVNTKLSARTTLRSGFIYDHRFLSFLDSTYIPQLESHLVRLNVKDDLGLAQGYIQVRHRFDEQWTGTLGAYGQVTTLNLAYSIEPRLGLTWRPHRRHGLSIGAGMHSQMLPLLTYFYATPHAQTGELLRTNAGLGFSRAIHTVLGHDWSILPKLRMKTEVYFQHLYDIPVEQRPSHFSMANAGESIGDIQVADSLVHDGIGRNMGLEVTVEKFMGRGYYFLFTASLYNSTYRGSDAVWRNSAFNGNYGLSALGGYELRLSPKNTLAFDSRITWTGGMRYVPIDLDASIAEGRQVRDVSRAYEERYRDYFRADIKVTFTFNGKRASHSLAIDFQNVFNTRNVFSMNYDVAREEVVTKYQLGFLPLVFYRVEF
jgi:hypothetical protein